MANPTFTDQPLPSFNSTAQATVYAGVNPDDVWTPPDGAIVIVFVGNSKASAADLPTALEGNGQTWDQVATRGFNTGAAPTRRITAYRAKIAAASAGVLSVTFPSNQTGCWVIVQSIAASKVSGANGADAVVQALANFDDAGDDVGWVELADFANHSNAVLACFGIDALVTPAPQSGFTPGTQQGYDTPTHTGRAEWLTSPDALATMTWVGNAKWGGLALEIAAATPTASATSIARGPIVGGVTPTTARFLTVLDSGGNFTLKYGTDPALAGATEVAEAANASTGFAKATAVSGLTPGTQYYYQAVGDLTSSAIHRFKTQVMAPSSLKIGMLSDFQKLTAPPSEPPGAAFVALDAEGSDLVLIGGDFDHSDPGVGSDPILSRTQTRAMWMRLYDGQAYGGPPYSMPAFVASILRRYPTLHIWDDHDYQANNANKGYPWRDVVAKTEYKRFYPSYALPGIAGGIWQNVAFGTLVEFFLLDSRSQRDPNTDVDDANKSMLDGNALGATGQKQWLKDALLASTALWKIVCSPVTWHPSAQKGSTNFDNWYGFKTEQNELIAFITANAIRNVVILSGDVHMGALDDGSHAVYPEIIIPPPNFVAGGGETFGNLDVEGTWSHGTWKDNGYGILVISPAEMLITIKDINGAPKLTMALTPQVDYQLVRFGTEAHQVPEFGAEAHAVSGG